MNQRERNALIRIVKQRYSLLRSQLDQREREIRNLIRQRVMEDHKAEAEKATKAAEKIRKSLVDLIAAHPDLDIESKRYGFMDPDRLSSESWRFVPADTDKLIRSEMHRLREESGLASVNLELDELGLVEDLLIGSLESADAKAFLADRIPDVDRLLPMPKKADLLPAGGA